jgi:hypothetical protein
MDEGHAFNMSPDAPQWIRDRVEADMTVCARMGLSTLQMTVLRCAECLAPDIGSQLHDYLQSRVCFHPTGYNPMINLISLSDLGRALYLAAVTPAQGVFNIPGADTLPLIKVVEKWGGRSVSVPGPLMRPLYRIRQLALGTDFDYALNRWRFHFNGVLDGRRASRELNYQPRVGLAWPRRRGPNHSGRDL